MLKSGNWTFEVLAAEEGWDADEKSMYCLTAGIVYIVISAILFVLVFVDSFCIDLGELGSWRQHYQGSFGGTISYLHRRRTNYRQRVKGFRAKQRQENRDFRLEMRDQREGKVVEFQTPRKPGAKGDEGGGREDSPRAGLEFSSSRPLIPQDSESMMFEKRK